MNITMQGKYQTRGSIQNPSRPVRILAIDLKSRFPVVGVLTDTTGEERPWLWTADGVWGGAHDRDSHYYECYNLISVPTKVEELRAGLVALVTMPSLITHDPIDTEAVALVDELIAAVKAVTVEWASVTWARKYSLGSASGVSALYGKFPNGYRLDLENPDIPDGDYDLIPRAVNHDQGR